MLSFRLRGFEDGSLGSNGFFNLAVGEDFDSTAIALGSEGGSFSLDDFGFRDGLSFAELSLGEEKNSRSPDCKEAWKRESLQV